MMKMQCRWTDKMKFIASADQHSVEMDAKSPIGSDSALTPKQLLIAGICGCTAMDVVAMLKKQKQVLEALEIDADVIPTEGVQPAIFQSVKLVFKAKGQIEAAKLLESVTLSQTKYCGVSAMISKVVPISFDVELNGKLIGSGQAKFE